VRFFPAVSFYPGGATPIDSISIVAETRFGAGTAGGSFLRAEISLRRSGDRAESVKSSEFIGISASPGGANHYDVLTRSDGWFGYSEIATATPSHIIPDVF
jgi:hypothetical protein